MASSQRGESTVEGRVKVNGQPVSDAVAMIARGNVEYPEIAAVTDAEGRFRLPCYGSGSITVQIQFEGQSTTRDVRVETGETTSLDVDLPA